mgnify:CR=1 FL=1
MTYCISHCRVPLFARSSCNDSRLALLRSYLFLLFGSRSVLSEAVSEGLTQSSLRMLGLVERLMSFGVCVAASLDLTQAAFYPTVHESSYCISHNPRHLLIHDFGSVYSTAKRMSSITLSLRQL